jgi:bifunctional non-homologous end joining protein LigD
VQSDGISAKCAGSQYRSGERSSDWVKWRANRGQEFVIGGYIPNGNALDSVLVRYYEGRVARASRRPFRRVLLSQFEKLTMLPVQ